MKIDLHLHSKLSKRPSQWVLQKIGCPESFTDPEHLYRITRNAGMSAMTLTDHNTIEGCLDIAHLPNTFISEEVTTYFPDDGCKAHVLVYDIDEAIHQDIQELRENIYQLVDYLNEKDIAHALAHPLFSINDRLTLERFEEFLLLFRTFELNGARDEAQNILIRGIMEHLSRETLEHLIDKHGIEPPRDRFWEKSLVGGSDDHSSLNVARIYTEVEGAKTLGEFLLSIGTDRCRAVGCGSTPRTLAQNMYGIAYQYFSKNANFTKYASGDVLIRFLDRLLQSETRPDPGMTSRIRGLVGRRLRDRLQSSDKVEDLIRKEGEKAITADPVLAEMVTQGPKGGKQYDETWFRFVNQVCNKVVKHLGETLYEQLEGARVFSIFGSIGAAGTLYALMAPYFVAFSLFGRDRILAGKIRERYVSQDEHLEARGDGFKLAHFTDTFYEINGVALTLRQQAELAERSGRALTVITCGENGHSSSRIVSFRALKVFEMPEYPSQKLFLPPFLEMLNHVYENGYTHIHSATPGPIGLAALGIARILKLPISGTYHTAVPQYAAHLTGDENIEQLVWRFTLWYYDQMQFIYVPSRETGKELEAKGIDPHKIRLYPRGVDTDRFHPSRGNGFFQKRYQLNGSVKLLYVGRISKEKNMPFLVDVFKEVCRHSKDIHLVMVGDGPYSAEMKQHLEGWPCTFTGYLEGDDLAEVYASSDLFVFPSTTDTFGNVILEAQASGLPVIVTDMGGPAENMVADRTGLLVPGNDAEGFVKAIASLALDPDRRLRMSREAHAYARERSFTRAFEDHWNMYLDETSQTGPDLLRSAPAH